jgi:VRR-NUC domain-containing protein
MTRRAAPEAQLHRSIVQRVRWCAKADTWITHIPNGGWRSPVEAGIFKSLGVVAGAPDLLIVSDARPLFIECKAPGRKLSPVQIECHEALRRAGGVVETVDDIDSAVAFLARMGVLR